MKMFVISDNVDTETGMRLAGVDGVVVHEKDEFKAALENGLADSRIGILLITEKLAKTFSDRVGKLKVSRKLPIVIEIPDRHGTGRTPDSITSYVGEAIGVKVK